MSSEAITQNDLREILNGILPMDMVEEIESLSSRFPESIEIKVARGTHIEKAIPHHGDVALLFGARMSTQRYILAGFQNWNGAISAGVLARTGTEMNVTHNTAGTITAIYNGDSTYNGLYQFAIIFHALS